MGRHALFSTAATVVVACAFWALTAAAPGANERAAPPQRNATAGGSGHPARGPHAALHRMAAKIRPLHTAKRPPRPGDWMSGPGRDEREQTFAAYAAGRRTTARGARRVIYIRMIGELSAPQRSVVEPTVEFLALYFGLPVKTLDAFAVDEDWPYFARRRLPGHAKEQLLTSYIRKRVLGPDLPKDGAVLLGLTAFDLWPGAGWNFVFGEATLEQRVGVWSIHRYGDPDRSREAWRRCLLRTLKVATHETGHMFSIEHCRSHECNMAGSNNLPETDRSPLALCPECLPKVCLATGVDAEARYAKLAAFCAAHGLEAEGAFYERSRKALSGP